MTAYRIAREHGRWRFGAAVLETRGSMRRGRVHTATGEFDLETTDRRRLGVVARVGGRPVVVLDPAGARVPGAGPGPSATWTLGRHCATLTRGADRVDVRAEWPGWALRVEVDSTWDEPDLVVLTACFAVLSRRRQRLITAIAIASARPGHG
jgi:hypothetical protein